MGEIKEFGVEVSDKAVTCCVPTSIKAQKPLNIAIKSETNSCCSANNANQTPC
jgi:hypothetical protein